MDIPTPTAAPSAPATEATPPAASSHPPAQETKAAPPAPEKIYEVKIDGKIEKMTEQQVLNYAAMSKAAQQRFDEAAKMRKEYQKVIETAKKDPIQALLDPALGLTKEQIREAMENWYNREFIETETLTQEQLELRKYKQMEAKWKQEQEQQAAEQKRQQEEAETAQHREILQQQIIEALEKSGLPKTAYNASRMAFYMAKNMRNGWEAPQELIIEMVRKDHNQVFGQLSNMPIEEAVKTMGDEFLNKLRQYDLQQLREGRKKNQQPFNDESEDLSPMPMKRDKISDVEVTDRLRKFKSGGF